MLCDIDITGYDTVFLDRDGVINVLRPNDYVKSWDEFQFLPKVLETLADWSNKAKYIVIVTNQRGVGRGLMTEDKLIEIHQQMVSGIAKFGGRIDKIYYCTDIDDTHPNRKPNIGMFQQALRDFPDINPFTAIMIGDSDSDMLFAQNAGIKGLKI